MKSFSHIQVLIFIGSKIIANV